MGKQISSADEMMRNHVIDELYNFDNPELISNCSPFICFVGIAHKNCIFVYHDLRMIPWELMRKALIYYFAPEGFQSRYIDDHYQVHNEFVDGTWKISVNYGDKLEIRLSNGKYVSSMFSTIENFGEDFKRVWNEYRRLKNS